MSLLLMDFLIMKPIPESLRSSLDFPDQYRVYPAPYSVSDPSSGKRTSLSAAISMSSLASSFATNAEHLWGQSPPLESFLLSLLTCSLLFYCWSEMPVGCS